MARPSDITGNVDETFIVMTSGASPARPTLPHSHFQLEPMVQTGPSLLNAECGAGTLVLRKSCVTFQACLCFLTHLSEADVCPSKTVTVHLGNVTIESEE